MARQAETAEKTKSNITSPEAVFDIDRIAKAILAKKFTSIEQLDAEIIFVAHERYVSVSELWAAIWKEVDAVLSMPIIEELKKRGTKLSTE